MSSPEQHARTVNYDDAVAIMQPRQAQRLWVGLMGTENTDQHASNAPEHWHNLMDNGELVLGRLAFALETTFTAKEQSAITKDDLPPDIGNDSLRRLSYLSDYFDQKPMGLSAEQTAILQASTDGVRPAHLLNFAQSINTRRPYCMPGTLQRFLIEMAGRHNQHGFTPQTFDSEIHNLLRMVPKYRLTPSFYYTSLKFCKGLGQLGLLDRDQGQAK